MSNCSHPNHQAPPKKQQTHEVHSSCTSSEHTHDKIDHDHNELTHQQQSSCCSGNSCQPAPITFETLSPSQPVAEGVSTAIRIMQMDCPTEETLIRKKLSNMPGVKQLNFNLIQRILTVVHQPEALDEILNALRSLGFQPELNQSTTTTNSSDSPQRNKWLLIIAATAALISEFTEWFGFPSWLAISLALLAIMLCGLNTYKKGWIAIKNGDLNINALMSIAVTGAAILGEWPEAAMVMVLFTIAELIEAKSLDRARDAIKSLMQLTPDVATVKQPDGSWQEIAAASIMIGDTIQVKPGERIALDGEITLGSSAINQAPITGESLPVEKSIGDSVFAGTINQSGSFEYHVTAIAGNTTLARIIHAIEEAQGAKAPTQRFVDRFSRIYTPIVFGFALLTAVVPPLFLSGSWHEWIYRALVLLIIACPCALVISTPVTIVSGLAAAARKGILIKGGVYLEEGRKLKWLALDKTGTITHGKPVQTDFELINLTNDMSHDPQTLAANLANRSDHPVSQAVANAAVDANLPKLDVSDFSALLGRGIQGNVNGQTYYLGNHRLVEELGRCSKQLEDRLEQLERQGKTVVMLVNDQHVMSLFAVADTVKESSRQAINELHQLGVKTIMLTGDNDYTAQHIANLVNIDEARGNQLPEDKLNAIETYSAEGTVGMVGDGINDAPALARADIGFAMGVMGTDTALETADVALMDDDLRKIPEFIRLSKSTHQILTENIVLALGIKAVVFILTLLGLGTMWMAVFADVGTSLLVVANGLRLLKK